MADVLGVGVTHFPPLALPDPFMSGIFKWALGDPELAAERRDPEGWPDRLKRELGDDEGVAGAAAHRRELVEQFERARAEIDAFRPDVVLVWGDDQYELFHEDCVPPFAVCAFDNVTSALWERPFYKGRPNYWNEPADAQYTILGHPQAGKYLTTELLARDVDMAYSYQPGAERPLPAAFANTLRYLDWAGDGFPYPTVFVSVNCYGRRLVKNQGGLAYLSQIPRDPSELDPPAPSPRRCFDVGAAIGDVLVASPWRVAVVASSSWSHSFLCEHTHFLLPDTVRDRELYQLLANDKLGLWRDVSLADVEHAGQHEMLNWFCLAGAVERLGLRHKWSELIETDLFTSNKVFAVFEGRVDKN